MRTAISSLKRPRAPLAATHHPIQEATTTNTAKQDSDKAKGKPCTAEVEYRALLEQQSTLTTKLKQLDANMTDIEKSVLQFYYTNSICIQDAPDSHPDHTAAAAKLSQRNRYYTQSAISQMQKRRSLALAEAAQKEKSILQSVKAYEEEVERTVVKGCLAEQREQVCVALEENRGLQEELDKVHHTLQFLEDGIAEEEIRCQAIKKEQEVCREKIKVLEDKKRKQMENVNQTREELYAMREAAEKTKQELSKRSNGVKQLEGDISRMQALLQRKKKLQQ